MPKNYRLHTPPVNLNGSILEYVDSLKYLGVILSSNFNDNADISRQLRSLYTTSNILRRKFSCCSLSVKLHLLESYCCNFYCASLWCNYTKQIYYKFEVAYNNMFRFILGFKPRDSAGFKPRDSASFMFANNRIDSFDARIRKTCFNFRQRLLTSSNNVIISSISNWWVTNNYMWSRWTNLLYI